jgi:hypothetical protein
MGRIVVFIERRSYFQEDCFEYLSNTYIFEKCPEHLGLWYQRNTAKVIRGEDDEMKFPNILALQEVENTQVLKDFNLSYLDSH